MKKPPVCRYENCN